MFRRKKHIVDSEKFLYQKNKQLLKIRKQEIKTHQNKQVIVVKIHLKKNVYHHVNKIFYFAKEKKLKEITMDVFFFNKVSIGLTNNSKENTK